MNDSTPSPFDVTPESVPFLVVPGLVLLFTLGTKVAPEGPLVITAFFAAAIGAVVGMLVYRRVRDRGPLARIGALTVLCAVLWGLAELVV